MKTKYSFLSFVPCTKYRQNVFTVTMCSGEKNKMIEMLLKSCLEVNTEIEKFPEVSLTWTPKNQSEEPLYLL